MFSLRILPQEGTLVPIFVYFNSPIGNVKKVKISEYYRTLDGAERNSDENIFMLMLNDF